MKTKRVVWHPEHLLLHRKDDIGAGGPGSYQRASFAWARSYVRRRHGNPKPELTIEVRVWGLDGEPAHAEFGRTFAADSLVKAKTYARELVADGKASLTEVLGRIRMYGSDTTTIEVFGTYEAEP